MPLEPDTSPKGASISAQALSGGYESLYSTLLERLGDRCDELPVEVCLHWPMREPTYSGRLLVVGQALNGWMIDGTSCSLRDGSTRSVPRLWQRRVCDLGIRLGVELDVGRNRGRVRSGGSFVSP